MPRDRNESRGRLRWSRVTALDVKVGSLLADVSEWTPTEPLPPGGNLICGCVSIPPPLRRRPHKIRKSVKSLIFLHF